MAKKKKKKDQGRANSAALVEGIASQFDNDYIGTFTGSEGMDIVENWIPSKNQAINYACGDPRYGAWPQGRIIELFGAKSSGKSLLLYDAGAQVQKMGGTFVLVDSESSFHKGFAKHLGINFDKLIYAHIRTFEETFTFIESVIDKLRSVSEEPILIGWDSIAATCTEKEEETEFDALKSEMGDRGRLMSRGLRILGGQLLQTDATLMCVNQTRGKIGVMFGKKTTTPGGHSLPFHASMRVEVIKTKKIYRKVNGLKVPIGHEVIVKVEKNKVRPPFAETVIKVYVDRMTPKYGLDKWSGLTSLLQGDGIIKKKKGSFILVADPDVTFTKKTIGKVWKKHIIPNIPEDLYAAPGQIDEDEED